MKKYCIINCFFIAINLLFCVEASAQDWKKIVPKVSSCKEIKKIFKVQECKSPQFEYKSPNYKVTIYISDGKNKRGIPKGKVSQVLVIFIELLPLKDYKGNLLDYEIKPVADLPNSQIYENKRKGISLEVVNNEYIQTILLSPPTKSPK
jgi:hypothetical protein